MKQITILGSGPEWQRYPQDVETWAVAKMLMLKDPPNRVDRLFSLDDVDTLLTIRRGVFSKDDFVQKVNDRNVPYYSSVDSKEFYSGREYPLKEVLNKFKVPYFTNTVCYMIALALFEGVETLNLYGVAQMGTHEYVSERGGVEFWLGIAMGMGVAVNIETPTLLLHVDSGYLYGYSRTIDELKKEGRI